MKKNNVLIVLIIDKKLFSKHNILVLKVQNAQNLTDVDFDKKFLKHKRGGDNLQKRKRNNQVKFYVNDEELKLINDRVRSANVTNRGAYLRKMAIDGYIVNVDTSDLKAVIKEMNAVGKNINQITRNANIYGIDQQDIDTLKAKVDEIWQLLKSILSNTLSANQ